MLHNFKFSFKCIRLLRIGPDLVRNQPKKNFFLSFCRRNNEIELKIPLLQKLSFEFQDVASVISVIDSAELNQVDFEEWKKRIYLLKKYNFSSNEAFKMVGQYPPLLKIPVQSLENVINQWLLCKLDFRSIQIILLHQPQYLSLDCHDIRKRMSEFLTISKSKMTLAKYLATPTSIMFDDWEFLMFKINYLLKEKRVARGEIFHSRALEKSIDLIKVRFSLLEKCGIYKKAIIYPHKVNKFQKVAHKNPHLRQITDVSDETFIKLAKISSEEYDMYNELYNNDEIEEDDSDDDDDDDEDDDEDDD